MFLDSHHVICTHDRRSVSVLLLVLVYAEILRGEEGLKICADRPKVMLSGNCLYQRVESFVFFLFLRVPQSGPSLVSSSA